MRRRRDNTLSAYWSKREEDLMFCYPTSKRDGGYLHSLFTREVLKELESRGFDPKTLRFSIMRKEIK